MEFSTSSILICEEFEKNTFRFGYLHCYGFKNAQIGDWILLLSPSIREQMNAIAFD
jgi:hypothetical protein